MIKITPEKEAKILEEPPTEPEEDEEEDEEKSKGLIDKANLAALRQEEANKKHEALLNRQERMKVEQTLGGKTEASTPPKEETPEEYAAKVMKGETPNAPTN